jgi:hypothetical protein
MRGTSGECGMATSGSKTLTVVSWMRNPCTPRGPRGEKRPADVIGAAVLVGRIATGDRVEQPESIDDGERSLPRRNPKLIVASVRTAEARRAVNNQHVLIARLKVGGMQHLRLNKTLRRTSAYLGTLKPTNKNLEKSAESKKPVRKSPRFQIEALPGVWR